MSRKGRLYLVTSSSGKRYVGATIQSTSERWSGHVWAANKGRQTPLAAAIRKYGAEAFTIRELCIVEIEDLGPTEQRAIARYSTRCPNGYNVADGGIGGFRGGFVSPEARAWLSAMKRTQWANPAFREMMIRSNPCKPETRKKMSETRKRQWSTDPALRAKWYESRWKGRTKKEKAVC